MGFMDFLKKKKKASKFDFPELPEIPNMEGGKQDFPDLPPLPDTKSTLEPNTDEFVKDIGVTDFTKEQPPAEVYKKEPVAEEPLEPVPTPIAHPKRTFMPRKDEFIEINVFRDVLTDINHCKSTLKKSFDLIEKVEHYREDEEKEFGKWHNALGDVQKKLISVDKTLFGR